MTAPPYVPPPRDACHEAAARLNVVLRLLESRNDRSAHDDPANDDEGYLLSTVEDLVRDIRNLLHQSLASGDRHAPQTNT